MTFDDLSKLAKAVVIPYAAICSLSTICWLSGIGEEIPTYLWVIFGGSLSELGIEIGIGKWTQRRTK